MPKADLTFVRHMLDAARNVDVTTRSVASDIPWREIAATRNRLIHHYFDVDLDIVWEIAIHDLPDLIPRLEQLARRLQNI